MVTLNLRLKIVSIWKPYGSNTVKKTLARSYNKAKDGFFPVLVKERL